MVTIGSRLFYGLGALALITALVYGFGSEFAFLGTTVLVTASLAAFFMGGVVTAFRDADPDAQRVFATSGADAEGVVPAGTPTGTSPWPMAAAAAVLVLALGLVLDSRVFVAGIVCVVIVILEWMVQAWSDRASADASYNRRLRDQMMSPLEVPVAAAVIAGVVVFGFSRIMLAVSADAGPIIFIGIAVAIVVVAVVVAAGPRISAKALGGVALLGAAAILTGGIISAAVGERTFHHEEPEGVVSVDNQSANYATVSFDGTKLETTELNIPKALPVTLLFENRSEERALVVELGPDEDGEMMEARTALREGPAQQAVSFRLLRPGEYRYFVEGHEDAAGVITVPGPVAESTTTTAG